MRDMIEAMGFGILVGFFTVLVVIALGGCSHATRGHYNACGNRFSNQEGSTNYYECHPIQYGN